MNISNDEKLIEDNTFNIESMVHALENKLPEVSFEWFSKALDKIESGSIDSHSLCDMYFRNSAMTRRKLGTESITIKGINSLWQCDEIARVVFLSTCLSNYPGEYIPALLLEAYKFGDEYEKIAIMKGMLYLDTGGKAVNIALHAGRTNNVDLFSAIALNNDYPSIHYSAQAFNQLVLKSFFMDLNIALIWRLRERVTLALTNLCMDLVKERLAADRQPPASIWWGMQFSLLNEEDQALFLSFADSNSVQHRHYVFLSLLEDKACELSETFLIALNQLLKNEENDGIRPNIVKLIERHSKTNKTTVTKERQDYAIF